MTYRQRFGRGPLLGLFAVFGVFAVVLLASVLAGGPEAPPPFFAVFWLGAMGWNAYWWLLRVPVRLTLDDGRLSWQAPLRAGEIPVSEITDVRPMRLSAGVVVVEHTGGRPLLVVASKGLRAFVDELAATRPDLDARLGWQARVAERFPGPRSWRQDD